MTQHCNLKFKYIPITNIYKCTTLWYIFSLLFRTYGCAIIKEILSNTFLYGTEIKNRNLLRLNMYKIFYLNIVDDWY